jgi:hypothetical protein
MKSVFIIAIEGTVIAVGILMYCYQLFVPVLPFVYQLF